MTTHTSSRRAAGFSLIEVLIAVIVLSFGLLALAALQGALFKASAEAKAQSVGLSLAQEKLEYYRGYKTTSDYQAITGGTDTAQTIGGVTFTRSWTVTRYAYPTAGGSFASVTNTGATAATYVANNEFKRIQVNVGWTDAEGHGQTVSLEDAIAALSPADSAKLARMTNSGAVRGPQVMIHDPTTEGGVIPIAIGDNTDTAATNPKPITAGNSNNQRLIETRFDVLTYTGANGATALATSRVETAVVGCTCDYGTRSSTAIAKRPTYWDGTRYVSPADASYAPLAGEASLNNNSSQSGLCTACCRDHHDPSGVAGAKFDPRNSSHVSGHYLLDSSTGSIAGPRLTGTYTEACRLIRVDGFFRVAADMYNDYMNLLETKNDGSTGAYLPTATATTNYQNFVLDYLNTKVVAAAGNYNNILPLTSPATVTTLESTHSLNNPATIDINSSSGMKWLHDRGLYVDYLEDEAVQAINDAKNNCTASGGGAPTSTDLRECVLRVLPFTSINLSELANWTPQSGSQIVVTNGEFKTSTDTTPIRGKVTPGSSPTNNQTIDAIATMRRSNTGLTTQTGEIDTDDASTWTDNQQFRIQGGSSGNNGGSYSVTFTGYTFGDTTSSYPTISAPNTTCNYATNGGSRPNPYTCTTTLLTGSQLLSVGHYNTQDSIKQATLTCTDTATNTTFSHTFNGQGKTINMCRNYSILSASGGGAVSSSPSDAGLIAEATTVNYGSIANGAALTLTLQLDSSTESYTCKYTGNNTGQDNNYTVTPVDCP
ncbi:type IV pilus modification protein PilV [Lysobacter terrae]